MKGRAALLGLLALRAAAGPSVDVTNDVRAQHNQLAHGPDYPADPGPRPDQYQEAPSVLLAQGAWSGGFTARSANVYRTQADTTLARHDDALYRVFAQYAAGALTARAGDFNTLFGRGLILSVVQNDAIAQDWTIRGGEARWRARALDLPLELHGAAGTVSNNMRLWPATYQRWSIAALEAEVEWRPRNRIGLRAGTIDDGTVPPMLQGLAAGRRVSQSADLSGSNLLGLLDYYGEAAQVRYLDPQFPWIPSRATDPRRGSGAYGSVSLHRGGWLLQAEGKRYRHLDNELNNPPLADRETEKSTKDNCDGLRLYAQYSFPRPDLTVFASAGRYRQGQLLAPVVFQGANVYGGFKLEDWLDCLDLEYAYGLKTVHESGEYPEKKTDAACTFRFTRRWSLGLVFQDRRNRLPGSAPYDQWSLTTQLARSPWGAVYLCHQFESLVNTTANPFPSHHLDSAGIRVNLKRGSYADLSGGRLRGGEVCAGGQCAILPATSGWKLDLHLRI